MNRVLVVLLPIAAACRSSEAPTACHELEQLAPPSKYGRASREEPRCAQLLRFAESVPWVYRLEWAEWLSTVFSQRVMLPTQTVFALTDPHTTAIPSSFPMEPPTVSCGGFAVDDTWWTASHLSRILPERPDRLFVSMSLDISSDALATIRTYQDFDCDHVLGVSELVGKLVAGRPAFAGGWTLVTSQVAPIEE